MILVDPYPRTLDQIFSPRARGRRRLAGAPRRSRVFAGGPATRLQRADPLTVERLRSRPIG